MTDIYQLTGECAYITMPSQYGFSKGLYYKGAVIPGDAPELPHLLSSGMAVKVGDDAGIGLNAEGGLGPAETPVTPADVEASKPPAGPVDEVEAKRAEARAKLPTEGSAPDGRAAQPVLVEYLVTKGYDYDAIKAAEKAELVEMVKKVSSS